MPGGAARPQRRGHTLGSGRGALSEREGPIQRRTGGLSMLGAYRVIDLTDERGQLAGMILGLLGADVIAVEPPAGTASRRIGPFAGDVEDPLEDRIEDTERSLVHWAYNRAKRSVVADPGRGGGSRRAGHAAGGRRRAGRQRPPRPPGRLRPRPGRGGRPQPRARARGDHALRRGGAQGDVAGVGPDRQRRQRPAGADRRRRPGTAADQRSAPGLPPGRRRRGRRGADRPRRAASGRASASSSTSPPRRR